MLTSLKIKGFRKYKNLELENFSRINFILGKNNVGKTSVLEAIFTWSCGQNIVPLINIIVNRRKFSATQQRYLLMEEIKTVFHNKKILPFNMEFTGFYNGQEECFQHSVFPSDILTDYDSSYKVTNKIVSSMNKLTEKDQNRQLVHLQLGIVQVTPIFTLANWQIKHKKQIVSENITSPSVFVSKVKSYSQAKFIDRFSHTSVNEITQICSALKRNNLIKNIVAELNTIFPEIKNIDMLPYPDGSMSPISILKKGTTLPLYAYGDGVQRCFFILGAMVLYKNSIICIDEIDSGFHPEVQSTFNKCLAKYAQKCNVQLFFTTNNIEFIDNFLNSVKELNDDYLENTRFITLRDDKNNTVIHRCLTGEEAYKAREDFNLELR